MHVILLLLLVLIIRKKVSALRVCVAMGKRFAKNSLKHFDIIPVMGYIVKVFGDEHLLKEIQAMKL